MPAPNNERGALLIALVIGIATLVAVITIPEKLGLTRAGWDRQGGYADPADGRQRYDYAPGRGLSPRERGR